MSISKREKEWLEKQRKEITIHFPEKEPGEEPATKKQIDYIRHLQEDIFLPEDLGKWQASFLIDKIKDTQDQFNEQLPDKWIENEKNRKILVRVQIGPPSQISFIKMPLTSLSWIPRYLIVIAGFE